MNWSMLWRLTLPWRTFTPVEKAILESIVESLPLNEQHKIEQQIESINLVQRILDWTETNFYCRRRGKPDWPSEAMFRNIGEFELAKARYLVDGKAFETTVWCVGGHIFSMITRPSIKLHCFGPVRDLVVSVIGDPDSERPMSSDLSEFLPESYLAFVENRSTEALINGWLVSDPADTYLVHFAEGDFIFLAKRGGSEWLLSKKATGTSYVYRCSEDSEPARLHCDFETAVMSQSKKRRTGSR